MGRSMSLGAGDIMLQWVFEHAFAFLFLVTSILGAFYWLAKYISKRVRPVEVPFAEFWKRIETEESRVSEKPKR